VRGDRKEGVIPIPSPSFPPPIVIPANAGIQRICIDPRFREGDKGSARATEEKIDPPFPLPPCHSLERGNPLPHCHSRERGNPESCIDSYSPRQSMNWRGRKKGGRHSYSLPVIPSKEGIHSHTVIPARIGNPFV